MSSITVVQCDNVLLRPFLCIDLPLKWGTLHKFHAQVGDHHNLKYHHNRHHIDCHFQCNDRDPWLRLLHPSDGLLGSEAHPQFLPGGDYVDADVGQNYHCEGDGYPRVIIQFKYFLFLQSSSQSPSTDCFWRCLYLLWSPPRPDGPRPEEFAGGGA